MNRALVDKLARALLYEGYILYPYRPSVKNRHRWTFGGLYPQAWSDAQGGADPWIVQTECLVSGSANATVRVGVRFLHLSDRIVGEFPRPLAEWPSEGEPAFRAVGALEVGGENYQPWQEAVERELDLGDFDLLGLLARPEQRTFGFPHQRALEPLRSPAGEVAGVLVREQQAIEGVVELSVMDLADGLHADGLRKITVKIVNRTGLPDAVNETRDKALMCSLVSTHTILGVREGEFVSLTDPPEKWRAQASACRNVGTWPILVGEGTERDTMLSSPIILPDYPQVAPESPGDLFDATEIDEILTLRIMTLTEDEKRTAAGVDERVRDLLARTESLAREQLMGLHGTVRGLRPVARDALEQTHG